MDMNNLFLLIKIPFIIIPLIINPPALFMPLDVYFLNLIHKSNFSQIKPKFYRFRTVFTQIFPNSHSASMVKLEVM